MLSLIFSAVLLALAIGLYMLLKGARSKKVEGKIIKAREYGLHEPVTIHPHIDPARCIGSGACVKACPEKDIIGLVNGKGRLINASRCVGHGACAAACPVGAITLVFGSETRGVDIPYVTPNFETNVKGVYIVGELGGMGLIKNAFTQGIEAVEHIASQVEPGQGKARGAYDVLIVGAGPAGIGASLAALRRGLRYLTIDQDDLGGTILHYPRKKVVMTSPVDIPLYGKVRLRETTKEALLDLLQDVVAKTGLRINSGEKMTSLEREGGLFRVKTSKGDYLGGFVVLAIGRRGTPRKLGVPGESLPKVSYRLLDPEQHRGEKILVVGGGDSAVEAAIALSEQSGNSVTLSYRGDSFSRIKPMNMERLGKAASMNSLKVVYNSNVLEITAGEATLSVGAEAVRMPNDYVYVFAGGELPNEFLKSIGVQIEKKFGTV
jgi:thioredoxin reductase/ferredoxin